MSGPFMEINIIAGYSPLTRQGLLPFWCCCKCFWWAHFVSDESSMPLRKLSGLTGWHVCQKRKNLNVKELLVPKTNPFETSANPLVYPRNPKELQKRCKRTQRWCKNMQCIINQKVCYNPVVPSSSPPLSPLTPTVYNVKKSKMIPLHAFRP
jgi:hypothetical protein